MDRVYLIDLPEVLSAFLLRYKIDTIRKSDLGDYLTEVYKLAYRKIYDDSIDLEHDAKLYHKLMREVIHFVYSLKNNESSFFGDFIKTTIELIPEFTELIGNNNLSIDYKVIVVSPTLLRIERSK